MRLLLVVDMIKGFLDFGNMAFEEGNQITDNIIELINNFKENDDMIVAFRDEHNEDSLEFKAYPPHCIKNTSEVELVDKLQPFKADMIDIAKNSTNGTNTQKFQDILKNNTFSEVVVCGVCTDICVLQSVLSLVTYFYQNEIDTKVIVAKDCVETFDNKDHNQAYYNELSFNLITNASAHVVETYKQLIK